MPLLRKRQSITDLSRNQGLQSNAGSNQELFRQVLKLLNRKKDVNDEDIVLAVRLSLTIEYGAKDDLSAVAPLITNLDPDDSTIVLDFTYELNGEQFNKLKAKWKEYRKKNKETPDSFLRQNLVEAFGKLRRRSRCTVEGGHDIDLDKEKISLEEAVAFRFVSARRDVTNKDNDQTLSTQTAKLYKSLVENPASEAAVEEFKATLRSADSSFSATYANMFGELITKVQKFGGLRAGESTIKIASTLQHRDILTGNATVMYEEAEHELPEHYNGLGYMNLISMIFEIDLLMKDFLNTRSGTGAAVNLLFIEEPEAHTHPQMQYVFIKNIRALLSSAEEALPSLQTVLSTHSAHIVAEAEFDSIKYLQRSKQHVHSKDLRKLEKDFKGGPEDERRFRFLKQYLTLHRAELFFADKVVLVEGDTERILLPAMMQKLDQAGVPAHLAPLLSQHVSVVEVGAYSQIYEKFLSFLGQKTLIITDIDSGYKQVVGEETETVPCCPDDVNVQFTSNSAICFFHGKTRSDINYFVQLSREEKTCLKGPTGKWASDSAGHIFTAFQTKEDDYHGRSFEDAFFSLNKDLLKLGHASFPSLTKKWYDKFMNDEIDALEFAERAVNSKPSLAIEVLLSSTKNADGKAFAEWKTPSYIEEGLKWLRGDFDA